MCKNPSRAGIGAQDLGSQGLGAMIGASFLDQAGHLGGGAKPVGLLLGVDLPGHQCLVVGRSAGRPVHGH